ncbi:MAG: hypothetical protein ACRYGA_02435 [Janthinobacterium lividum]
MLRLKRLLPLAALMCAAAIAATPAGPKLAGVANTKAMHFTLAARATVSYGSGAAWTERTFDPGTYVCHPATFGLPSAVATAGEQCKYTLKNGGAVVVAPPVAAPALVRISAEFASFSLAAPTTVTFGLGSKTVSKPLPAGTYNCGVEVFGADPLPTIAKECTAPAGTAAAPVAAVVAPVVASSSIADPAEYRRVAALFGTLEGLTYRYGSPARGVPAVTLPGPRADTPMNMVSVQNPNGKGGRGCGWTGWCGTFQIGALDFQPGDYSSSILNIGYVPNPALAGTTAFPAARYLGIGSAQSLSVAHGTVSWKPEVSWATYDGKDHDGGANDENTERLAGVKPGSPIGTVPMDAKPVAMARGYGRGGWINNTLTVSANGWITSAGSNTSHNFAKIKLPEGKTPTAIAITNSGEFALVTLWDTAAVRGQVAVIALKDGCQACLESNEAAWEANWGSWPRAYPGLPGLGNYIGGKVLGLVDLPDDLKAPTEISVTTGRDHGRDGGYQTVMNLWNEPIDTVAQRARYYNGGLAGAVANAGVAVIVSKSEQRAVLLDLGPLMRQFREQYLGSQTDAQWREKIASRGDGDTQFPPTFAAVPAQKPVVIKTIALPSAPTAVKLTLAAPHRALIATEDGQLHVYDTSAYLNQAVGSSAGKPGDVVEMFAYPVGANPTGLAYVKEKGSQAKDGRKALYGYAQDADFLWVVSRGEQKLSLLQFNAARTSLSTFKTIQDSRIADPIAAEDVDNHGTESYLVTVATGDEIANVAYGPLITWTYDQNPKSPCPPTAPCGPIGKDAAEYAGAFKLPGRVFHLGGGNIN